MGVVPISPQNHGKGLMERDFVIEHSGLHELTYEEHKQLIGGKRHLIIWIVGDGHWNND